MRLIDAEAFEESIEQIEWYRLAENGEMVQGATSGNGWYKEQDIYNAIEDAPTIEAKPVIHAHWERKNNETKCSNCEFIYYSNHDDFNYCPNCGAQMDSSEVKDE